ESMDLVNEEDDPLPGCLELARFVGRLPNICNAARYRRQDDDVRLGVGADHLGQAGLSATRRSPQDHRGYLVALDGAPERLPLPQEMLLADKLVQVPRPHARGQRRISDRLI